MSMRPLSHQFLAHVPAGVREELTSEPELERTLNQMVDAGRTAWPEINLQAAEFLRHVGQRLRRLSEASEHAADLYLACACAQGDRLALAKFEERFLSGIERYIARVDRSASFKDEVLQILRTKLFVAEGGSRPKIHDYTGRGSLGGWVAVSAVRTARNLARGRGRTVPFAQDEVQFRANEPDPEMLYLKSRYGREFNSAFESALGGLGERERNIMNLYYVEGMSSNAIARGYHVTGAAVRSWLKECRRSILEETQRLLRARLGIDSTSELDSLIKLLRSQFDISVSKLLKRP
jgi:RNA polymerase sigma-70 factor, ECF subfamily